MSLASLAATQASASPAAATKPADPLASLSDNFGGFLKLLLTQLKNQDPSSPMDANAFTTELVQFSGVEQQIKTNTGLDSLIQLTQAAQTLQSSSLVGRAVTVQSPQLSLQAGVAKIGFTDLAGGPATIDVYDAAGHAIREDTVSATPGANNWSWDGKDASGATRPDGAYTVTVRNAAEGAGNAALAFTVTATATGITRVNGGLRLQLGGLTTEFNNIQSVTGS